MMQGYLEMLLQKDEILDQLAVFGNVAQFVAFRPTLVGIEQTFSRVTDFPPNYLFSDVETALTELLAKSIDGKINVRSYVPHDPRSREFIYGLETVENALLNVQRLASDGLHLIVNETIDINDGGVSGVVQGGVVEFAPDDTPRCVEKPGTISLPFEQAIEVLSTVYGFIPNLSATQGERTEFSIHPSKRGWEGAHTLYWEHEKGVPVVTSAVQRWPNQFSRLLGDKTFGLLIAQIIGVPVPRTLVINRRVAPFEFGTPTDSFEVWTRTCPIEPQPGLYTTVKGWIDPFELLAKEDPDGQLIASVLKQDAIPAHFSGAAIVNASGNLLIEGRAGEGDRLMLGIDLPEDLPPSVVDAVNSIYLRLHAALGPVRFEWVYDGRQIWVVQLHRGATHSSAATIVPGEASDWIEFRVEDGLDRLRELLGKIESDQGVMVNGEIGLTSHIADVLRRVGNPARISSADISSD